VAVERGRADAGAAGDLVDPGAHAALGERRSRGREDRLAVLLGIAPART
jgi:hypothetical protein